MGEKPGIGRRLAAAASLLCLLGALGVLGYGVAESQPWRLAVVLVLLALTVVGLWYGLSRRGVERLVGGGVAALALAGALVVTLTGEYRGLFVALAGALAAASAWAARHALRPVAPQPREDATPVLLVTTAHRPVLIMNPKSGGGKAERFRLVDECKARGIEPIVLGPGDDLTELATQAIGSGADIIGMAGGDGSQALVATLAAERGIPYVCVPAGTRNHFALDLGLDRDNVVGALDAFADAVERRVDLARLNGRVFVNNACMGLYARIVQSDAYRDAKLKTTTDMLPEMIGPDAEPFDLRYTGPDGEQRQSAHLLLVSNNPYELAHLAGRGTRKRMDTGTLGVAVANIANPAEAATFVALEAVGRIRAFRGWDEWTTPTLTVDSEAPIEIGVDGEALLMEPPLVFESLPGALRVRLPGHAVGLSPAALAVTLSGSTIGELIKTAAGRSPSVV